MNAIAARLAAARASGRGACVPFLTAGFPDPARFRDLLHATSDADLVEIGVPFSDPLADGPTIAAASERALAHGMHVETLFETLAAARGIPPIVLMTYANPFLAYGPERFVARARAVGVAGLLLTDVPVEEGGAWRAVAAGAGIGSVQLVAPTTAAERLPRIVEAATAFVYCVSRAGTTGARTEVAATARETVARVRAVTAAPCLVGFGVSTPEQVREVCSFADGVVVGSALLDFIAARVGALAAAARAPRAS